jgi:cytoskeletal protein CcmA (bactofilin family)
MDSQNTSTVLSDIEISGTVTFLGTLHFDGQLRNGDIVGEVLVIGPKGRIEGNVNASSLVIHGSVTGDVTVTGRCELKGSASLHGNLVTNRLSMDDGATFIGGATITPEGKPVPPKPPVQGKPGR